MFISNTFAISCANFSDGLYLPFSRKTMVSLRTPTLFARSTCVSLSLALRSLILVFIGAYPSQVQPRKQKDHTHAHHTKSNHELYFDD